MIKKHSLSSTQIAVSLFTGAGGLDIGMERAGFVPRFVSDIDPVCVETLKHNKARSIFIARGCRRSFLDDAEIRMADICSLSGSAVRNRIGRRLKASRDR